MNGVDGLVNHQITTQQSFLAQSWGMTENKKEKESKQKAFQGSEMYK